MTFGVVCSALFVVAILAAIVPARRASRMIRLSPSRPCSDAIEERVVRTFPFDAHVFWTYLRRPPPPREPPPAR